MSISIFSAAMSADSDGLFGTLDAELEQAVSLFSKQHNGASAPLFCSLFRLWDCELHTLHFPPEDPATALCARFTKARSVN